MLRRGATLAIGWALAVMAITLFAWLGTWQYGRQHEKQAMLDAAAQVLAQRDARPLALAADPDAADGYTWAAGDGQWADAPAVLLDNQQRNGRPGVRVYRLFEPAAGEPLLVELGWLPVPADRSIPAITDPPPAPPLEGLLLPPPSAGLAAAAIQPQADGSLLLMALDRQAVAAALGREAIAPRVLRLDPDAAGGYARDLEILPNTLPPEKHLGYAVQWFGLALTVLVTALILTFRRRRAHSGNHRHSRHP
ncbi:MAG TPA: SURF1 family protein [Candidatus Luteimonas excrementigallinarum]|nr:SURF1 family protein [Candidatus Luteimonas excrementigallinarum]